MDVNDDAGFLEKCGARDGVLEFAVVFPALGDVLLHHQHIRIQPRIHDCNPRVSIFVILGRFVPRKRPT